MTVAVVGAGISGAACARALADAGQAVRVLDRGRGAGGRRASRSRSGRPGDTGASYPPARDARFSALVDGWLARGLARPWTCTFSVAARTAHGPVGLLEAKTGPLRYGAPAGLRTLVEDLLADLPLATSTQVTSVGPGPVVDGQAYDAVVLAMPDPQAERLLHPDLPEERAAVAGRRWEPVLALAAAWDRRRWDDGFDGCFVSDSDVLGWVADDGRRRGDGAPVLVAHSTSAWAADRLTDPAAAAADLVAATSALLGVDAEPAWSFVQRWSFARPAQPRDAPFHLGPSLVGLCGDGWGAPRVETAWLSGHLLGQRLAEVLSGTTGAGRAGA